jgi:hypothetical protein
VSLPWQTAAVLLPHHAANPWRTGAPGGVRDRRAAAFIVRPLSIERLRWLVVIVVIYAAVLMLLSARMRAAAAG